MCYRLVSHMMRCDVRPVISNGRSRFVDGYAEPSTCACPRDAHIKGWLRCDKHGCCRMAVKIHLCVDPDSCLGQVTFHRYRQVRCEIRNPATRATWHDKEWEDDDLAAVDGLRLPVGGQVPGTRLPFECPLFQNTLGSLLHVGRSIAMLEDTVDRMVADNGRLTALMDGRLAATMEWRAPHRPNHELAWMITLANGAVERGLAEKQQLIERFGKIREELEKLTRWGERVVTGLDDAPDCEMLSESDGMEDEESQVTMGPDSCQKHLIIS
ncbi:hypothetical protein JDV02_008588 [Purpureocillium takamizusanense]|uniref:Uncharacterized protein n=1 Tax=Purpureocillium takamizusanense TaxID=2060973 RepID=A0A9Q8QPZ6_9HYPO|nr:uncharacterized protein JDV02_008588 [Purpureocillium takamizusanense]UNI22726.1 hypothetical protein JDV02_008588 [Purpureocillium takamizusanense]